MDTALYEQLEHAVHREARNAEARWNKLMEAADIEQEIWLWMLERPGVQAQLKNASGAELAAVLKKSADQICSKERLDYDHFSGNFHYTPSEVRTLLEAIGQEYDVHDADERVDLQLGLDELLQYHPNQFEVLQKIYWLGEDFSSTGSLRMAKSRAVDKLCELMNRKRNQRERDRTEGLGTKPKIPTVVEDDASNFHKED